MKYGPGNVYSGRKTRKTAFVCVLFAMLVGMVGVSTGCGADDSELRPSIDQNNSQNNKVNNSPGTGDNDDDFVEEREEFLVREVAATDRYVFVPNSAPGSNTVAMIDGEDFSIVPFRVGLESTEI